MIVNQAHNEFQLEILLWWAIAVLFTAFLCFLTATFIKRFIKLQKQKKSLEYQKFADDLLFNLLFGGVSIQEAVRQFQTMEQRELLNKIMIKSILVLHRNYSGEQKTSLENFFVFSELTSFALKHIRSSKWEEIVDGIRILSTLNVQEAFEVMKLLMDHPNSYVKKEAFIGLITLKGTGGVATFTLPEIPIDDWTQSCVLYQLKIRQFSVFEGIQHFFDSSNESLIVLGARIVDFFQLSAYYPSIPSTEELKQSKYRSDLAAIHERIKLLQL